MVAPLKQAVDEWMYAVVACGYGCGTQRTGIINGPSLEAEGMLARATLGVMDEGANLVVPLYDSGPRCLSGSKTACALAAFELGAMYVGYRVSIADDVAAGARNQALVEFAENNRATGFASEYTSPAGNRYYDVTTNRGPLDPDGPLGVGHHGGCSEIGCLLQAVDAEGPAGLGGQMTTIRNRPPNSPIPPGPPAGLGTPATPCPQCEAVLHANGIDYH